MWGSRSKDWSVGLKHCIKSCRDFGDYRSEENPQTGFRAIVYASGIEVIRGKGIVSSSSCLYILSQLLIRLLAEDHRGNRWTTQLLLHTVA